MRNDHNPHSVTKLQGKALKYILLVVLVKHAFNPVQLQWNLSIPDTTGTQLAVLYTVEPLYRRHHWDPAGCPVHSGTSL